MNRSLGITLYKNLSGDRGLWIVWILLGLGSLLAVYSATGHLAFLNKGGNTEYYLIKQMVFLFLGGGIMYFCSRQHYLQYNKLAPWLLVVVIPLLLLTWLAGTEINYARRWLTIPVVGMTFQTSDFAKLALIIYLARVISYKQDIIKEFNNAFLPIIVPVIVVCGLIMPADFSTACMLFLTCILMMFVGRVSMKFIGLIIIFGLIVVGLFMVLGTIFPDDIRAATWVSRISDFFNEDVTGHQIMQSKIAIAEGGIFGVGPGGSLQRNVLPHPYSDFIYAIICEEYGLFGGFTIIALYTAVLYRCVRLISRFPKSFGALLAAGLGMNIVIQAYLNIAVSVDLIPVTGLALPIISMGGTSMIFTCIAFGIILSVSRYLEQKETLEREHEVKEKLA